MSGRIDAKIGEIERYCLELKQILPDDFNAYERDFQKKAACERYFEKIVEAVVDLAYLWIKKAGFRIPEDDKQAFTLLANANLISRRLEQRLKEAKGMRNVIAHEYGGVNDELVFHALNDELLQDALEFVAELKKSEK